MVDLRSQDNGRNYPNHPVYGSGSVKKASEPKYEQMELPFDPPISYSGPSTAMLAAMKAANLVTGDRNSDYGHPIDDFTKQAAMWSVIFGVEVTPEKVAMAMVCVKIARELNHPKEDNVIDGVGYWLTIPMIKEERARREAL